MKSETTQAASRCTEQRVVGASIRPKRAGKCQELYRLLIPRADGTFSPRTTWCCAKRIGIRVKDWRCVGLDNHQCPNNERNTK